MLQRAKANLNSRKTIDYASQTFSQFGAARSQPTAAKLSRNQEIVNEIYSWESSESKNANDDDVSYKRTAYNSPWSRVGQTKLW